MKKPPNGGREEITMEGVNIQQKWEIEWKPKVLSFEKVPQELVAEIFGITIPSLQARMRAGVYPFAQAFKLEDRTRSEYIYEIYPLKFVKWYEGDGMLDSDLIGTKVFNRFLAYIQETKKVG